MEFLSMSAEAIAEKLRGGAPRRPAQAGEQLPVQSARGSSHRLRQGKTLDPAGGMRGGGDGDKAGWRASPSFPRHCACGSFLEER